MGIIKELSEELIKQIAAGEVVERPASVVKELVENSIDANAKKIEINIERGGKNIKISDDGDGIDPEDIPLLFKRHATSKLKSFEDLWDINSLGFRGEALASVSSISKVNCKSKHKDLEVGFETDVEEGKINKKPSSISKGTVFEIKDLFYNVPAREKFLKADQTELDHISDIVFSLALSHPEVSFNLLSNKNNILKTNGSGDLKEAMYELLGNDLRNNLIQVSSKNHFVTLNGFISALEIYRSNKKSIFTFINGRSVKCPLLSKAINSAFEGLIPPGKYPVVILNLTFKPRFVDVNVHPSKKEVRYTHPNDVYSLVLRTIQDSVSDYYKEVYKEKSVYGLQANGTTGRQDYRQTEQQDSLSLQSYTNAAFEFYKDESGSQENLERRPDGASVLGEIAPPGNQNIFSVNTLKCSVTYSDKPIANITRIGNKSIFEVGTIFENDLQIVFSGEIIGDQDYQKEFFNSLAELSSKVYKFQSAEKTIQGKIINSEYDEDDVGMGLKPIQRKKPPLVTLQKVWDRDNWSCVYCEKQLLDPEIAKEAIKSSKDGFTTYINEEGKEVTIHIIREHIATYDHYLPASKLPQFNFDIENLYASCPSCNMKKSDSMDIKSWVPEIKNNWKNPLEIAGMVFETPKTFKSLVS
jgi:DNA mismatch repair protein MutL